MIKQDPDTNSESLRVAQSDQSRTTTDTQGKAHKAKGGSSDTPAMPITFTPAQLIAWADKQEEWGTSPAWATPEEAVGYARALRHLRYYVKNPIQEII